MFSVLNQQRGFSVASATEEETDLGLPFADVASFIASIDLLTEKKRTAGRKNITFVL